MKSITRSNRVIIAAGVILALAAAGCDDNRDVAAPSAARLAPGAPSLDRAPDATEPGYYNGLVYTFQFPSGGSNDQRELVLPDCFRVGPDFTQHAAEGSVATLYALFLPGANQHECPGGIDVHDHVLSAVPGSPGYATLWDLKEVLPGENANDLVMPITSEAALFHARDLKQVIIVDDEILLKANVIGPGR
jgi:hypothetical protein